MVTTKEKDYQTKVCPQCGSRCFADMDTCYGCLYHFDGTPSPEVVVPKKKGKKKHKNQKTLLETQGLLFSELVDELYRRGLQEMRIPATVQITPGERDASTIALEIKIDRQL